MYTDEPVAGDAIQIAREHQVDVITGLYLSACAEKVFVVVFYFTVDHGGFDTLLVFVEKRVGKGYAAIRSGITVIAGEPEHGHRRLVIEVVQVGGKAANRCAEFGVATKQRSRDPGRFPAFFPSAR